MLLKPKTEFTPLDIKSFGLKEKLVHVNEEIDSDILELGLQKRKVWEANVNKNAKVILKEFKKYYNADRASILLNVIATGINKYTYPFIINVDFATDKTVDGKFVKKFIKGIRDGLESYLSNKAKADIYAHDSDTEYYHAGYTDGPPEPLPIEWYLSDFDYFLVKKVTKETTVLKMIMIVNGLAFSNNYSEFGYRVVEPLFELETIVRKSWLHVNTQNSKNTKMFIIDSYAGTPSHKTECAKQIFGNVVGLCLNTETVICNDGRSVFSTECEIKLDKYVFSEYCKLPLVYTYVPNNTRMNKWDYVPSSGYRTKRNLDYKFDSKLDFDLLDLIDMKETCLEKLINQTIETKERVTHIIKRNNTYIEVTTECH